MEGAIIEPPGEISLDVALKLALITKSFKVERDLKHKISRLQIENRHCKRNIKALVSSPHPRQETVAADAALDRVLDLTAGGDSSEASTAANENCEDDCSEVEKLSARYKQAIAQYKRYAQIEEFTSASHLLEKTLHKKTLSTTNLTALVQKVESYLTGSTIEAASTLLNNSNADGIDIANVSNNEYVNMIWCKNCKVASESNETSRDRVDFLESATLNLKKSLTLSHGRICELEGQLEDMRNVVERIKASSSAIIEESGMLTLHLRDSLDAIYKEKQRQALQYKEEKLLLTQNLHTIINEITRENATLRELIHANNLPLPCLATNSSTSFTQTDIGKTRERSKETTQ